MNGVNTPELPIWEALPPLREALAWAPLTLSQAPPGAGKSTALPLSLLDEPWLGQRKLLLLQPRRVAARAVATRLAQSLGERLGQTVGLRVRFETQVSEATRLEVMTQGVLLRRLQRDPELSGVGLILFDEFHERSLDGDLSLALLREVQAALRDDLRLLLMSATLPLGLTEKLGNPPLVVSEGRSYPVSLHYLAADPSDVIAAMPAAIERAAREREGDILAFLPGLSEIRRVQRALQLPEIDILPLHGDLPLSEQQRALQPGPRRRVVLASSIAETSLTLPGVRAVVDSGLSRSQQYDAGRGLSRLVTARVSRDSAEQRAGRAGRVAPGAAYRLWSERTQATLLPERPPEILGADLSALRLQLAGWGALPEGLPWLDAPSAAHLEAAESLLRALGALEEGRITPRGRQLLDLPTHPRLANMLLGAAEQGLGAMGADLAALLEERDPLPRGSGSDVTLRLEALRRFRAGEPVGAERAALERVERLSQQWRRLLKVTSDGEDLAKAGKLLLLAYPERAAQQRPSQAGQYLLAGGQGAALSEDDPLLGSPYLLAAQLDMRAATGRILLAAELDPAELTPNTQERVEWDTRLGAISAREEARYGALLLRQRPLAQVPEALLLSALEAGLRREGLGLLPWDAATRQWQARVLSLRAWRPEEGWPDVGDEALLSDLSWLRPFLTRARRRDDFARVPLLSALETLLPWNLRQPLSDLAPTHLGVPSGHRIALEYRAGEAPILAVKLQELFGLADTPTVNAGRTPVLLHLLSPARRPVQITQDLRSFWEKGYFEVRKDLRGQYPKHPWPDDPWSASPTRGTKKRP